MKSLGKRMMDLKTLGLDGLPDLHIGQAGWLGMVMR